MTQKLDGGRFDDPYFDATNIAAREWGWTQDEAHWKLVIQVVVEFIKTVCHYNWKIRNVIESNILPEHHGIGDRYEDLIICPTYVGILTKEYVI